MTAGRARRAGGVRRDQHPEARIERKPGREPVDPLAVARFVVLAKASSLAGAIFAGFYAGAAASGCWSSEPRRSRHRDAEDGPPAIAGLRRLAGPGRRGALAGTLLPGAQTSGGQPDGEGPRE